VLFHLFLIQFSNIFRILEPYELAVDRFTAFKRPPRFTFFQRRISLFWFAKQLRCRRRKYPYMLWIGPRFCSL